MAHKLDRQKSHRAIYFRPELNTSIQTHECSFRYAEGRYSVTAVIIACQKRQSLGIGENWGPANTGRSPDPDQTGSSRLVNDRAGFDLFFLGLVFAAGYTPV